MEVSHLLVVVAVMGILLVMAIINRYRSCPPDKILVIYGSTGRGRSARCVAGGGAFVWPIIQDYAYLSLPPIGIDAHLTNALSRQNIRVDVRCRFTIGISTEPKLMMSAAQHLLGLSPAQIQDKARDILFGQLRLVLRGMTVEELYAGDTKLEEAIQQHAGEELKKIGLKLINANVTDIRVNEPSPTELSTDSAKFEDAVKRTVEAELKKIGLKLLSINLKDIQIPSDKQDTAQVS